VNESLPQPTILERLGAMAATIALQLIQLEMPSQATNRTFNTPFLYVKRIFLKFSFALIWYVYQ